jgi:hypothetical protein
MMHSNKETVMNSRTLRRRVSGSMLGRLAMGLVLAGMMGIAAAPARADDDDRRGFRREEGRERRDDHRREYHRERERERWHERRDYVYAPPPVVYAPPPRPGVSIIFPFEFR